MPTYKPRPFRPDARGPNIIVEDLNAANDNFELLHSLLSQQGVLDATDFPESYDPNQRITINQVFRFYNSYSDGTLAGLQAISIPVNFKLNDYRFNLLLLSKNMKLNKLEFNFNYPPATINLQQTPDTGILWYEFYHVHGRGYDRILLTNNVIVTRSYDFSTLTPAPYSLVIYGPRAIDVSKNAELLVVLRRIA